MNYEEISNRLNDLKIEDFIWIVYIVIIVMSWYSNSLEREYFLYNDLDSKDRYRKIIILIFSILIVVYLYFLKDAYDSVKEININDSDKKKELVYLSFVGSLFIAVSGFIFLYIAYNDEEIDVELAFN